MTERAEKFLIVPDDWTRPIVPADHFGCPGPVEVDLGCGKGRFLVARAKAHPQTLFLGLDRMLLRLRKVDKMIAREGLTNVRLLRIEASYGLEYLLPPASVSTFYIFFPDPWPKRKHHRRRLVNEGFLSSLYRVLVPGGRVHLATDHPDYFTHMQRVFARDERFASIPPLELPPEQHTDFEREFLGRGIAVGRASYERQISD